MSEDREDNQGEGNVTAAKAYNKKTQDFVETENVEGYARDAAKALDSEEGKVLRDAEEQARKKAREEDPQVKRTR